jgi:hypothetical protein
MSSESKIIEIVSELMLIMMTDNPVECIYCDFIREKLWFSLLLL